MTKRKSKYKGNGGASFLADRNYASRTKALSAAKKKANRLIDSMKPVCPACDPIGVLLDKQPGRVLAWCAEHQKPDNSYSEFIENGSVLQKAKETVDGRDKQAHYGPPEEFMARLAQSWTAYLKRKLSADLTPFDAAMMMASLKILRLGTDPSHEDSLLDLAGYAHIGEKVK